jgi:hypothetical protein
MEALSNFSLSQLIFRETCPDSRLRLPAFQALILLNFTKRSLCAGQMHSSPDLHICIYKNATKYFEKHRFSRSLASEAIE